MIDELNPGFGSLLATPAPCVLTTYRRNGTAVTSPVWFRFHDGGFEVVIAEGDVKLRHLEHHPNCSILVFETAPPFRGIRAEGVPTLRPDDGDEARRSIASRYLGDAHGTHFVERRGEPGVVLRMSAEHARAWDLAAILPTT